MKRRKLGTNRPLKKTSSTCATIVDLPDELLAKIVEDLVENEAICRLSLTCKRLHFLVLPMFFSRNKLKNPECGFFHYYRAPPETLEAVRTALFVRNLSAVTFQFNLETNQAISEVRSLRGLLRLIPPAGVISLGLPTHLLYRRQPLEQVRNREVERWGRDFIKLLRTIIERGCRDLVLYDPVLGYHPDSVPPSATEPITAPTDCRKLRSRAVPVHPHVTPGISTVKILCWQLFQPFYIEWVIDMLVLNRKSIVCIHLSIAVISPVLLSRLSRSLNLPAVKEVNITSNFGVGWVDWRSFLDRHPSITSLCLDGTLPPKIPQYPYGSVSLPCLTHLAAPLPIVTWALGCRNAMPLLTSVNVFLRLGATQEFDDALQAVAIHSHIVSLQLTIGIPGADFLSLLARHVREDKSTRIITSLNHISSLSMELDRTYIYDPFGPRTLKTWLYLFPCLEHVTLDLGLLDTRPLLLSAEARHGIVTGFANQVSADRPMMKTLSINRFETVNLDELRKMPGFKDVRSAGSRKSNRVLKKKGNAQCSCN